MKNLSKIKFFLRAEDHYKVFLYFFFIFVSSFLEILSIGLIFPIISLILDKNFLSGYANFTHLILQYSPIKFLSDSVQFQLIANFVVYFFLIILFKNLLTIYINFYRSNFVFLISSYLKLKMLSRFTNLPYLDSIKIKSTDILTFILNQLASIVSIIENLLILSLEISIVLIILIFLLIFDTNASLILVLIICFFSLILIIFLKRKILFYGEMRRKSQSDLFFLTSNMIAGIKEIKLSGFKNIFIKNFSLLSNNELKASRNFNFISQIPRSYLEVIIAFSIAIFLFINLLKYDEINNLMLSSATVFLASGIRIIPSIGKIINSYNSYKYNLPTLSKIHEFSVFLENIKDQNNEIIVCKKNISFENLHFSYDNKKNIFNDCNIDFLMGDKIGIFGDSGSGKTTLINLISGLIKPTKGKVFIDGFEKKNFILSNLSMVSQNPLFINDTIKNNINFTLSEDRPTNNEINLVLENLYLSDVIKNLEKGMETIIGEKGSKLSGGQLQRLSIARAILKKPDILILDEATNALDKKTERHIIEYIFNLFQNKIVIIISHDRNLLDVCNYILTINNNKILKNYV